MVEVGRVNADTVVDMIRRTVFLVAAVMAVAACGGSDVSPSTTTQPVAATVASTSAPIATSTSTSSSTTSTTLEESEIDEAILDFVADVEELLLDTEYESLIAEDPEIFIATGLLFCERLDGGATPEDVLVEYVENLTDDDIADADDDILTLAGSLLGSAVGYLCPEYVELLEDL